MARPGYRIAPATLLTCDAIARLRPGRQWEINRGRDMPLTMQDLQLRAATDEVFRSALLADPRGTLAAEGVEIPSEVEIRVIEATATTVSIVIPPLVEGELHAALLENVAGGTQAQNFYTQDIHCFTSAICP
jgi:hypothetical protein